MQGKKSSLDMTRGEPAKLLILFAIPMLIGGIFQLMYTTVDTIIVGRYVSIEALAAIGATSSTIMFFMQMGGGLTNSLSVIVSQAEGGAAGGPAPEGGLPRPVPGALRRGAAGAGGLLRG